MHRPYPAKARPWDSIVDFFAGFASVNPECEPMYRFVSQVASSRYAEALFPLTSMHTLTLSRTPEFELNREVLRIDFDCRGQRFYFVYYEHPFVSSTDPNRENPGHERKRRTEECGADHGFDAFERFLALKKWVI